MLTAEDVETIRQIVKEELKAAGKEEAEERVRQWESILQRPERIVAWQQVDFDKEMVEVVCSPCVVKTAE